ncbi:MAG: hypothetical protein ACFB0B_00685 [Thermonemataceae bacterium]
MKRTLIVLGILVASVISANNPTALQLSYHNKDARDHTFDVDMSDESHTVTFKKSSKAAVTLPGADETAIIYTDCDEVAVSHGDKIVIEDGCIYLEAED